MKFVCERCHTKYSIADEKVRGKVLKVRCKTCTNVITVRETGASVEDAPTAIDAGHAAAALAAPVSPAAVPAASPGGKAAPRGAGAAGAQHLAGAAAPTNGTAPRATRTSIASPTLSALGVSGATATSASGGAMAGATVAPRRATGAIPVPPPLPIPDDVEWYLAVDGVQTGPFSRAALLDKVMVQPKTADVHVWNADLEGWKPPRELPELSTELMRRRRSLTPAPPPPPKRLFPTGSSPRVGGGPADEPKAPAAISPTTLEARPHPYPGSPAQARAAGASGSAAHAPTSAPGIHPHSHPPGHTGKNGTSNGAGHGVGNGVGISGFGIDQLVGGDASAAI